ncbi:hypothetical protein VNO78_02324 [Psophocarpus tetragonolobus]|uniref:Uncharacterized protein n=1 Tax=Psophocarpus tetragonolobus TaxID=3891 RepID=A0AAN9TBC2_PSOTE
MPLLCQILSVQNGYGLALGTAHAHTYLYASPIVDILHVTKEENQKWRVKQLHQKSNSPVELSFWLFFWS